MSRFDEHFERDMTVIAERVTPSPDAWSQIQQRIADREPHQETEIIMLTDTTITRRRWPLVAAAAAVVALAVAGIAVANRGDGFEVPADTIPTVVPDTEPPSDTAPSTEPAAVPSTGGALLAGAYFTDSLGVPLTFEVPSDAVWTVGSNDPAGISLGSGQAFVAMTRLGSFYNAEEALDPELRGLGSIAPDDIDAWVQANDVSVESSVEGTIGGRDAKFRQIRVPESADGPCPPESKPCIQMASNSADLIDIYWQPIGIGSTLPHSFWIISMDEYEPFGIWVHTSEPDAQLGWLDELQPFFDSIEFGEPGPATEDGTARVPLREQFFATATTPRGDGTVLQDGTIQRIDTSTLTGDVTGEMVGTGIEVTPANGYDDIVFTGTIAGIGTGTLTMYQEWTASQNGDISFDTHITDATGDFAGITGRVITALDQPDESGPVPIYTSRLTFMLAIPRSG